LFFVFLYLLSLIVLYLKANNMTENSKGNSRRGFITKLAKGVVGASLLPNIITAADRKRSLEQLRRQKDHYSANDQIQIALIGAGGMGTADASTAIQVPGVKLVAACDLYDGRLADAKKKWGSDIYTTRDYKEILERNDVDAVIIATPDSWHKDISVAAMNKGKSVYCEKPMVHDITERDAVVDSQNRNKGVVFEVGSQGVSSLGNE